MVTKWSVPRGLYGRAIKGTLLADILDRGRPALVEQPLLVIDRAYLYTLIVLRHPGQQYRHVARTFKSQYITTARSSRGAAASFLVPLSYTKKVVPNTFDRSFPTKPSACRDRSVGSQLMM
uniref:Uncharacterized protein n=1 Tax=Anopheles merus TaxID=30066 RepID=A0A182UVG5_ANOME